MGGDNRSEQPWLDEEVAELVGELRAPLSVIAADAAALAAGLGPRSTAVKRALRRIDRSIETVDRAIRELVDLHSEESSASLLVRRRCALHALVEAALAELPPEQRERIDLTTGRQTTVRVDRASLCTAITTLVRMAIAAARPGTRVIVGVERHVAHVVIYVLASPRARHRDWSGFPLARAIAEAHRGRAAVDAIAGAVRFSLELPAEPRRNARAAVLVVDDNLDQLAALSEILRQDGLTSDVATTGAEALERVAARAPDLMIVDLHIPDMNGVEVLRRARERVPELPAVVLTGFPAHHPDVVQAVAAPRTTYLAKPIDVDALLELVASSL